MRGAKYLWRVVNISMKTLVFVAAGVASTPSWTDCEDLEAAAAAMERNADVAPALLESATDSLVRIYELWECKSKNQTRASES